MNYRSLDHEILWLLRIPKTLTAIIAGAAGIFRCTGDDIAEVVNTIFGSPKSDLI